MGDIGCIYCLGVGIFVRSPTPLPGQPNSWFFFLQVNTAHKRR
ncbi:hypothetical protein MTATph1_CDS0241 [Moorella phage MTATph1]